MYIPARERAVLLYLLETNEFTTVKDIAVTLDVSERTIHRDLKGLDEILQSFQLKLQSKKGQGIKLLGNSDQMDILQQELLQSKPIEYTKDERITMILTILFSTSEPTKLIALANDLNVTIATISSDLDIVSDKLAEFKLALLRKRGYGVLIEGKEEHKRAALKYLIAKYIDPFEVVHLFKTKNDKEKMTTDFIAGRLLDFVDHETIVEIEANVEEVFKLADIVLADNAYIGLIVHLALAIQRIKSGEKIHFDTSYLVEIQQYEEFDVAKMLIDNLQENLNLDIPLDEIGYITMHLLGAKLRESEALTIAEDSAMDIAVQVRQLMDYVGEHYDTDFQNASKLLKDLVTHLKPALFRIKRGMKIVNPLLKDVENNYQKLMDVVTKGVALTFPTLHFPADEIGYLAMHFGAQLYQKIKAKHIEALVICSSGIGTARILATRLRQNFPEIKLVKTTSMLALDGEDMNAYDIILSTIKLHQFNRPYIIVSPILLEDELREIQKQIEQVAMVKEKTIEPLRPSIDFKARLSDLSAQSAIAQLLISQFTVASFDLSSVEEIVIKKTQLLRAAGIISDESAVKESLISRYRLGGLAIPDRNIALFHTRSQAVECPHFSVVQLKKPIRLEGMDKTEQTVDTILFMLANETARRESLALLSYLSTLLIQDDQLINLLRHGQTAEVKDYLAEVLYMHILKS